MRKFLLILLLVIAGGCFYAYTHKSAFHKIIAAIEEGIEDGKEKERNKNRSKIPKVIVPDEYAALDSFAKNAPKQYAKNIKTLARYLIQPAKNDREKARILFTWVATHITYDADGYNKKQYGDGSAEGTLQSGHSVCEGYGNLLAQLCKAGGLEAVNIFGYAKGYGYVPGDSLEKADHAWNAIKIDGEWHLFDATWASGYGENVNGKLVVTARFDPYWFDVDPKAFIFTHLPEKEKWQLNEAIIAKEQFRNMPYLQGYFFKLGFDVNKIFAEAITGKPEGYYAEVYESAFPIKFLQGPYTRLLPADQEVAFTIRSDYAEKIALLDGDDWSYFKKAGNTFTLTHTPVKDSIFVVEQINWYDEEYKTIIRYQKQGNTQTVAMHKQR